MAKRQNFRITDLSGGLNPDQNPVLLADNEATSMQNLRLDKLGSLLSRQGFTRFYGTTAGTDLLTLGRWRPKDAPAASTILVARADGMVAELDELGYTALEIGFDTAAKGEFVAVGDRTLYANGVDLPHIYDGTDLLPAGMAAPSAPAAVASNSGPGTVPEGVYGYALTYYDSGSLTESNPSPTTEITVTAPDDTVTVTLPTSHARADKLRIYRTDADGAILYLEKEQAIGPVSYIDEGLDPVNILIPADYNRDVPLAYEHIAYHKGYVFGSIGNTLYWSRPFEPESWPGLNTTEVPFEGNDTIRALWAFQDTLLIFGRKNVILLAGNGGADWLQWSLSRADIDTGAVNSRCLAEVDGSLVYLDHGGLRTFPGGQPVAPKLDRTLAKLPVATIEQASLAYLPEERSLWLALPSGTYTIHLPNRAIGWHTLQTDQILPGGVDGFSPPLFIDAAKRHVNLYGGADDNGDPIEIEWKSKIFQLTNPETTKFFRRIGAFASRGTAAAVTITISDSASTARVTLTGTGGDGGTYEWDAYEWADADPPVTADPALYWSAEGLAYFIGALPAQTLFGHTMQVTIAASASAETEIVSPITFEYREANRFLGQ